MSMSAPTIPPSDAPAGGSIELGDLMRAVAADSYQRLERHVASLPAMSPELRTEKTRSLIARMRKELAQLYALMKWLQDEDVQRFLTAMDSVRRDLQARHLSLNVMQDGLFFTHQSLYGQRVRPLEVAAAADILSSGSYRHFPEEAFEFLGRSLVSPPSTSGLAVSEDIMNVCIASKLKLGPRLPDNIDEIDIQGGVLRISKTSGFTLKLSLDGDLETSPWTVVSIDIHVAHQEGQGSYDGVGREAVNFSLLQLLRRLAGGSQSPDTILELCTICMHAVCSAWLRLLYLQALDASRAGLAQGVVQAEYFDTQERSLMVFDFWRLSKNSGPFQYQLQVSLPRSPSGRLSLQVFQLLDSHARIAPVSMQLAIPNEALESALDNATLYGVCFESISSFAVQYVSKLLLNRIYALLANDPFKEVKVDRADNGLIIVMRPAPSETHAQLDHNDHNDDDVVISVAVSAMTGRFAVVDRASIFEHNKDAREAINLFVGELNGAIQNLCFKNKSLISDVIDGGAGVSELKTLPGIGRCLTLHSAAQKLSRALGNTAAMHTADKCEWIDRMLRSVDGIPLSAIRQSIILKTGRVRTELKKSSRVAAKENYPHVTVVDAVVILTVFVDAAMKTSVRISSGILVVSPELAFSATLVESYNLEQAFSSSSSLLAEGWLRNTADVVLVRLIRCIAELMYLRICFVLSEAAVSSLSKNPAFVVEKLNSSFVSINAILAPSLVTRADSISWTTTNIGVAQLSDFSGSVLLAVPSDPARDSVLCIDISPSAANAPLEVDAIATLLSQATEDNAVFDVFPSWKPDEHASLLDIGGSNCLDVLNELDWRPPSVQVVPLRGRPAFAILCRASTSSTNSAIFSSSPQAVSAVRLACSIASRWASIDAVKALQLPLSENFVTLESKQIISMSSNGFKSTVDFFLPGVSAPAFSAGVALDGFDSAPGRDLAAGAHRGFARAICTPSGTKANPLGLSEYVLEVVCGFCIEVFSSCIASTSRRFSDAPFEYSGVIPPNHALALHALRSAVDASASICLAMSVAKVMHNVRTKLSAAAEQQSRDGSVRITDINVRFRQVMSPARWSLVIVATTTRHLPSAQQSQSSQARPANGPKDSSSSSMQMHVRSALAEVALSVNGGALMYSAKLSALCGTSAPDAVAGHVLSPRLGEDIVRFVGTMH